MNPLKQGGAWQTGGFDGTPDASTENIQLVLDEHGVVSRGGRGSSGGSTTEDEDIRLVDNSPSMTALRGGGADFGANKTLKWWLLQIGDAETRENGA